MEATGVTNEHFARQLIDPGFAHPPFAFTGPEGLAPDPPENVRGQTQRQNSVDSTFADGLFRAFSGVQLQNNFLKIASSPR
jgi:hypothetical protein